MSYVHVRGIEKLGDKDGTLKVSNAGFSLNCDSTHRTSSSANILSSEPCLFMDCDMHRRASMLIHFIYILGTKTNQIL